MDWTQHAQAVGESFSGVECAGLRTLLQRQSGNFFRAFHTSNIEVCLCAVWWWWWRRRLWWGDCVLWAVQALE